MNEKKSAIGELANAFKSGLGADILKRIMPVVRVERDGITRTGAAEHLGMAGSWGAMWYGRYLPEGLPGLRTRPRSGGPPLASNRAMKKIRGTLKKTACRTTKEARGLFK